MDTLNNWGRRGVGAIAILIAALAILLVVFGSMFVPASTILMWVFVVLVVYLSIVFALLVLAVAFVAWSLTLAGLVHRFRVKRERREIERENYRRQLLPARKRVSLDTYQRIRHQCERQRIKRR